MNPLASENCDLFQPLFLRYSMSWGRQLPETPRPRSHAPEKLLYRHADVFTLRQGFVFHGDLEIAVDAPVLRAVANKLSEPVYVLREAVRRNLKEPLTDEQLTRLSDWNSRDGYRR